MTEHLSFAGYKIVVNDAVAVCYYMPVRSFAPKDWHGGCARPHAGNYAYRVQKKWTKRFGKKPVYDHNRIIMMDDLKVIMLSRVGYDRLKAAILLDPASDIFNVTR